MRRFKNSAIIAGIAYIAAILAGFAGVIIEGPIIESSDKLVSAAAAQTPLLAGQLFTMLMAVSVAIIGFALYPVIKEKTEIGAAGYLGARIVEAVLHLFGAICMLSLVTVSRMPMSGELGYLGELLVAARDWAYTAMDIAVFPLGAVLLYSVLYKHKLAPRWIMMLGIVFAVSYFTAGILAMFGIIETLATIYVALNAPLALQELVFAVWMIAKGFKPV